MTKKEAIGALAGVVWSVAVFSAFYLSFGLGVFTLVATVAAIFGGWAARG